MSKEGLPDMKIMRRTIAGLATFCAAATLVPTLAHARDMQGRLGLGYNSEFANSTGLNRVPGVSIKYALTRDIAAEVVVGISTASPTNTVSGIKLFKNIFFETNLNFYGFLGGAAISADSRTGAQFLGGFGAEFFIPGIESLGFAVETGGSFDNVSGSFALKTLGVSFLDAGIHFYF
jgi:hypothetical protein